MPIFIIIKIVICSAILWNAEKLTFSPVYTFAYRQHVLSSSHSRKCLSDWNLAKSCTYGERDNELSFRRIYVYSIKKCSVTSFCSKRQLPIYSSSLAWLDQILVHSPAPRDLISETLSPLVILYSSQAIYLLCVILCISIFILCIHILLRLFTCIVPTFIGSFHPILLFDCLILYIAH